MKKRAFSLVTTLVTTIALTLSSVNYTNAETVAPKKGQAVNSLANVKSEAKYSYKDAIRETVFVQSSLDTDENGVPDRIAVDIIRPKESDTG